MSGKWKVMKNVVIFPLRRNPFFGRKYDEKQRPQDTAATFSKHCAVAVLHSLAIVKIHVSKRSGSTSPRDIFRTHSPKTNADAGGMTAKVQVTLIGVSRV